MATVQELVERLKRDNLKIATAESCTGGMLAKLITDISGASQVFEFGAVVYSNFSKHKLLGVPDDIIIAHGAVSEQVAKELSVGIAEYAGADIGIGITGIAGPEGGSSEKPVGLVYFSIYIAPQNTLICRELHLNGSRDEIRRQTVETVIDKLMQMLG